MARSKFSKKSKKSYNTVDYSKLVHNYMLRKLLSKLGMKGHKLKADKIKALHPVCRVYLQGLGTYKGAYCKNKYKIIYDTYLIIFCSKKLDMSVILSSKFYKTEQWRELRKQVISYYGTQCMLCGFDSRHNHVDHIKPRSDYPHIALEFTNMQVLCAECNREKSNIEDTDYRYGDTGMGYTFPWDDKITW